MIIGASSREPRDTAVRRLVATSALLSANPASSAYSRARMRTLFGDSPMVTPASSNVSWAANIFQRPAMKATGEKMSPCRTPREMLKVLEVLLPMRTHPEAALNIDWIILRTLVETFATESVVKKFLALGVKGSFVINECDLCFLVLPEDHAYCPFQDTNIISGTTGWPETSLTLRKDCC